MRLDRLERGARQTGAGAILLALASIFWGIRRGLRHPVAASPGRYARWLRRPGFYLLASAGYFGLCWRLWRPVPLVLSLRLRSVALLAGSLLYFPGIALVLWGRLALGDMYNVSSSSGAVLYTDHRLVSSGPFAHVRHPMYVGILLTGLGGLLLYRTWTFVFVLAHFPALVVRARREETTLAAALGAQWSAYCQHVPPWRPRLRAR